MRGGRHGESSAGEPRRGETANQELRAALNDLDAGQVREATEKFSRYRADYLSKRRRAIRRVLKELRRNDCTDTERSAMADFLGETEPDAAPETLVSRAQANGISLRGCASFRQLLAIRTRRGQLAGHPPEWTLNQKQRGYDFVSRQGIAHPQVRARAASVEDLGEGERRRIVVKPEAGAAARGVYLIRGDGRIRDQRGGRYLDDWATLLACMKKDLTSGRVAKDRWRIEDLITEDEAGLQPGRDLKFYAFYGHIGLVLEVSRHPEVRYSEWDGEGRTIDSGKFSDNRFIGDGPSAEQLRIAGDLSARIPAPFIRIDFIRSAAEATGMAFCEFTPRPGGFERFSDGFDRHLGELYLQAQARLESDLLSGKRFGKPFV